MRPSRQEPEIQPDHPRRQDYDAYIEEEDEEVDNDDDDDETGDGWFEVLQPQSKVLACGDRGDGKSERAPYCTTLTLYSPTSTHSYAPQSIHREIAKADVSSAPVLVGGMCEWTEIVRVIKDRMGLD